jgi:phosphoribosylformylglycinamidine cyclo-ligase
LSTKTDRYATAGVDYSRVDALKRLAQRSALATAKNLPRHDVSEIEASRGESAYVMDIGGLLIASITERLGTKALIADAVRPLTGRSHYDTIAQDTIAAAVNDLISVGATPLSVHAYWAAGGSEWFSDVSRMEDLVRGWQATCDQCAVSWGGGETPALKGLIATDRIDLAASCVGLVKSRDRLMLGEALAPGDAIILFASSGIHANGVSLARQLAERLPEGFAARIDDGRSFGEALLDPTVLYVTVTEALFEAGIVPHYAINITGHGWRKLMRRGSELAYRIVSLPMVPPVLKFIQHQLALSDQEAYGTFNMGAGFAVFVHPTDVEEVIRVAASVGVQATHAGSVESGGKRVIIEPIDVQFDASELQLRV